MKENWKIYYADNTTFSDKNGSPFDSPALGVIVITQKDNNVKGWRTVMGDYYIYQSWGWEGVDYNGLLDYLMTSGYKTVKFGRTISNDEFNRIFNIARVEAME